MKKEIVEKGMEELKRIAGSDEKKMKEIENKVEVIEKERRKKNVVNFNMPEAESTVMKVEERYNHDERKCGELFTNGSEMQDLIVVKLIRLGKRQEGKHRSLLVKLSNDEDRRNIILKAKNLRKTTEYRKVYIGKDMTMEERAVDKNYYFCKIQKQQYLYASNDHP